MVERKVLSDSARYDAMKMYGGADELRKLERLECTITKVGEAKTKGLYVTGIQGYAPSKKKIILPKDGNIPAATYTINKGDQVVIRSDWDERKGHHVNFESNQAKIAFIEHVHKSLADYMAILRENNAVTHHSEWSQAPPVKSNDPKKPSDPKKTPDPVTFDREDAVHKKQDALAVIDNWAARFAFLSGEEARPKM